MSVPRTPYIAQRNIFRLSQYKADGTLPIAVDCVCGRCYKSIALGEEAVIVQGSADNFVLLHRSCANARTDVVLLHNANLVRGALAQTSTA